MYTDVRVLFNNYATSPIYYRSNHIVIRCPFCGDSIKNPLHAHLYIEPDLKVFWCARCYTGGSLSYLLGKIKDRFTIDVSPVINALRTHTIRTQEQKTQPLHLDEEYTKLFKLKQNLILQSQKYKDMLAYYFLMKDILIEDYLLQQLPISMYSIVKPHLTNSDRISLPESVVQFTMGNRVIYRYDFAKLFNQDKKISDNKRFRNLYLNVGTNYSGLTYTLFDVVPYNFNRKYYESYNRSRKLELIVSEGLTDIVAFVLDNKILEQDQPVMCLVLNGKFYETIKLFDKTFDKITVLVDADATTKASVNSLNLHSEYQLIVPPVGDYRSYRQLTSKL